MKRKKFPLPGRERVGERVTIRGSPSPPTRGGGYFFALFYEYIRLSRARQE
jgi:hypothetical protein